MRYSGRHERMDGGRDVRQDLRFVRWTSVWTVAIIISILAVSGCQGEKHNITAPSEPTFAVTSADLAGMTLVLLPSTIMVGDHASACAYFRFTNGKVAMRNKDSMKCSHDFISRYTYWQRSISFARQRFIDGACVYWSSSDVAVATISIESCSVLASVGSFTLAMGAANASGS
jgi:hypothetical protein